MKEHFKDFFYFTRGEKNGIIILLIILLLLIALPYISPIFIKTKPVINKNFNNELALFSQSLKEIEEPASTNRLNQFIIERYDSLKLFHFNPNTTSKDNFKRLGLTDKQISTIANYLGKGGKFVIKDDFRKIYGIRHQQYQILKPFLLLPDKGFAKEELEAVQNKAIGTTDTLFVFDPNKSTPEELKKLGLTEKQCNTIVNYRNKGGQFISKDDFRKIYGISIEQFNVLEPYIYIPSEKIIKEPINQVIELNTATATELSSIKGIAEYTANAIISYRNKLGGYNNVNQLLEIKSIKPEYFEKYKNNLAANPEKLKKISLNFAEIKEFVSHPYLNYEQAKEIIIYRSKKGPYQNIKELLDKKIIPESNYQKIKPYLVIN